MASLLRLTVSHDRAVQLISSNIKQGREIISGFALGAHSPMLVLQHRLKVSQWSSAAEDRINSLFVSPVIGPGDLMTPDGSTIDLGRLKDLPAALQSPLQLAPAANRPLDVRTVALHRKALERSGDLFSSKRYDEAVFKCVQVGRGGVAFAH